MSDLVIPFDLTRMIFGDVHWLYYAEILVRTCVIYGYTLMLLRWIGGRSIAQLSIVEFLLVIALGSAVGDSVFLPDVPLFHGMFAITVAVFFAKGVELLTLRSSKMETMINGEPSCLVQDGVTDMDALRRLNLTVGELRSGLRINGMTSLGQVRAAYMEPSGDLSVFAAEPARRGLRIEPPPELEPYAPAGAGPDKCCTACGLIQPSVTPGLCRNCNCDEWTDPT